MRDDAPSLRDLLAPGRTVLLTTVSQDGPRTRPVITQADPEDRATHLGVLTTRSARKVAEVEQDRRVTLSGPTPSPHQGWFSCSATAAVEALPEDLGGPQVVRICLEVTSARVWTVFSPAPWDNEVTEVPLR